MIDAGLGRDGFSFKIGPDRSEFRESIRIDPTNGTR